MLATADGNKILIVTIQAQNNNKFNLMFCTCGLTVDYILKLYFY